MSKAKAFRDQIYGRPNTVKTKLSMFNNHIAPSSTIVSNPDDIVLACIKSWKEDELSLGTIKGLFVLLGEYMKFTYDYRLDKKRLMFQHFGDTMKPQTRIKAWNWSQVDEVGKLLAWFILNHGEEVQMLKMYLQTGMRKGELLGLVWADIDFLNGCIRVQRSKDFSTGIIGPTKTGKYRSIPMNKITEKILTKRYNVGVNELNYVFKPLDLNSFLVKVGKLCNVPVITVHGLRHTFATSLLEKGTSPKIVSELLGHDKLSTTLDIYWNYLPGKFKLEDIYVNT